MTWAREIPGGYHWHSGDDRVWAWYECAKGIDYGPGGMEIPYEEQLRVTGCVCHTLGPFTQHQRQPRLQPYCTESSCQREAAFVVFPPDREAEYACWRHLLMMREQFGRYPIWTNISTDPLEPPFWSLGVNDLVPVNA